MNTRQMVEFYEVPRLEFQDVVQPHNYTFRPTGKAGRKTKQQRAFDYLKRSGALRQAIQRVKMAVTQRRIVPADFMGKLYQQRSDLFRDFNLEGRTLLIGAQDYAEMMSSEPFQASVPFQTEFMREDRGKIRVCGLTVQVIPWMRGLLVMP